MKVQNKNHVYDTLPPYLNNRMLTGKEREDQIVIGLKVATLPEQDDYRRELSRIQADYAVDKAEELQRDKSIDFVGSKFSYVKGLEIEGVENSAEGMDFKTFYKEAPPELVNWCIRSVMSTTELSLAERKNFVPESDLA